MKIRIFLSHLIPSPAVSISNNQQGSQLTTLAEGPAFFVLAGHCHQVKQSKKS